MIKVYNKWATVKQRSDTLLYTEQKQPTGQEAEEERDGAPLYQWRHRILSLLPVTQCHEEDNRNVF